MKLKIGIWGSCVTRDIFSELDIDRYVGDYRARTSLHSFFEDPIRKDQMPNLDVITSPFQRRMVEADFRKKDLNLLNCEYLIIDFIDERFDIVDFENSKVTLSNELSKVIDQIGDVEVSFKRGSVEDLSNWRLSCEKFSKRFVGVKTILHSSRFATHKLVNSSLEANDKQNMILKMNELLLKYEQIFIEEVSPVLIIKVNQDKIVSNVNHRWGVAPFHYILPYYKEAYEQLEQFVNSMQKSDTLQ